MTLEFRNRHGRMVVGLYHDAVPASVRAEASRPDAPVKLAKVPFDATGLHIDDILSVLAERDRLIEQATRHG